MRGNSKRVVVENVARYVSPSRARKFKLVSSLVVACRAARFAIHQSVIAEAYVNHRLAQAAVFLTLAISFGLLALRAAIFCMTGTGAHEITLSLTRGSANVTSVTKEVRGQGAEKNAKPLVIRMRS